VRNDLLHVFCVPFVDSLGTDVMDAVCERYALAQVSAIGPAELARTPIRKLAELVHRIRTQGEPNECSSPDGWIHIIHWSRSRLCPEDV